MRRYFVTSFALYTVLSAFLTLNWAIASTDWPTIIRLPLVAAGIGFIIFGTLMTLISATTKYRQP